MRFLPVIVLWGSFACSSVYAVGATGNANYKEVEGEAKTSALPVRESATQEYRLMDGCHLAVDTDGTTSIGTSLRVFGENTKVTLEFFVNTSSATKEEVPLTRLSCSSFWAGVQPKNPDKSVQVTVTLNASAAKAITLATDGGRLSFTQEILVGKPGIGVNACWVDGYCSLVLDDTMAVAGWVVDPVIYESVDAVPLGHVALVGLNQYDAQSGYSYSDSVSLVAHAVPEPASSMLLCSLTILLWRRRR